MGMDLTKTQKRIRGMFWLPDEEDKPFSGILILKAGKSARLETAAFNYEGTANWFPNRPKPKKGETITLTGDDFYKAMHPPARKIIHGHDEQGAPITLIHCSPGSSHSTLAMESHNFSCNAAVFGVHLHKDDLNCHGIRLHLDHLDTWVGRCAFQRYSESYET